MNPDESYFTLTFVPSPDDRNIINLVDSKGVPQYTKRRVPTNEYKIEVYDTLSECLLATVSAPSATSKHKTLQLHNPDTIVELRSTGTLSFKWGFHWEEHDFEWKREECYIVRKPDPAVRIAVTKEPAGRLQTKTVQLLYYNINRFDVADRKGLEIVILTALLTFSDLNEAYHAPKGAPAIPLPTISTALATPATAAPFPATVAALPPPLPTADVDEIPPEVPPKPAPRAGVDRVAEMHAVRNAMGEGDVNEVYVWDECTIDDYAAYAEKLLEDDAMLFVTIRSASAMQVPKVLRVVEETKRLRHKSGIEEDEELHQYVVYETDKPTQRKAPRRINLNDPDSKKGKGRDQDIGKYVPPTSLAVHLSKIDMPELQPKPTAASKPSGSSPRRPSSPERQPPPPPPAVRELSDKERKKLDNERLRAEKEGKKAGWKSDKNQYSLSGPLAPNQYSRPPPSPTPTHRPTPSWDISSNYTPAHQSHPYQPSPSPSQLNNPAIYAAPPPAEPRPRPTSMAFPLPGQGPPPASSFYGSGYLPPPGPPPGMDGQTSLGSPYRPGPSPSPGPYMSTPNGGIGGRPSSYYQPSPSPASGPGKGPVSSLLDMWSKH